LALIDEDIPDYDNSLQEWVKNYYSLHDLVNILEYSAEIDEVIFVGLLACRGWQN